MKNKITFKQRRFVEAYICSANGNATEAARISGYKHPNTQGPRLFVNVSIRKAIRERVESDPLIANRIERQRFWTELIRNPEINTNYRLRASEILGKSQLDFIERLEDPERVETYPEVIDVTPADFEEIAKILHEAGVFQPALDALAKREGKVEKW